MKPFSLIFISLIILNACVKAQTVTHKFILDEKTVVVDSAGKRLTLKQWRPLLISGVYMVRPINPQNNSEGFTLVKSVSSRRAITPPAIRQEKAPTKEELLSRMPKPAESIFFTTGEKIKSFVMHDIDGNKFKLKDLEGKVVVLNFWFIGCPPCRMELPELNELALSYANDPDVVFIAIGLDEKSDIRNFIKDYPLAYHIVEDGRMYADLYRLNLYPTNVVLDKEGKVRFHSTSYYPNNTYWIKKTIDEAKQH